MVVGQLNQSRLQSLDIALGSDDRPLPELLEIVLFAELLGVRNVWLTESRGRDVFVLLGALARHTSSVNLGTGITGVFSRTPTTIAQAAATLSELMPERTVNLGLGASGRGLVETFHGVPFSRPRSRLQETVRIVDHILREGHVPDSTGEFTTRRARMTLVPVRNKVNIFVAAGGATALDFIGQEADGWLPIWPSLRHVGASVRTLTEVATSASRATPEVAGYLYGDLGDGPDADAAVRATLAWYIAANGTAYRSMFTGYGYQKEVSEIVRLWEEGNRLAAQAAVSSDMLENCTLVGNPSDVLRRAESFAQVGVRAILRVNRARTTTDVLSSLQSLADVDTA